MPRMPPALGSPALVCGDSQSRPHPDDEEHAEGDALVQIPMFDSNGHQQPPDEQDVGVIKVLDADLVGRDSEQAGRPWGLLLCPWAYGV